MAMVIKQIEMESAMEAIEWAKQIEMVKGKYPTFKEFLIKKGEIYDAKREKLKRMLGCVNEENNPTKKRMTAGSSTTGQWLSSEFMPLDE